MVSIYKIENRTNKEEKDYVMAELRGLSSDEKPADIGGKYIDNGSIFIEIDTGKIFFYDLSTETWKEV